MYYRLELTVSTAETYLGSRILYHQVSTADIPDGQKYQRTRWPLFHQTMAMLKGADAATSTSETPTTAVAVAVVSNSEKGTTRSARCTSPRKTQHIGMHETINHLFDMCVEELDQ